MKASEFKLKTLLVIAIALQSVLTGCKDEEPQPDPIVGNVSSFDVTGGDQVIITGEHFSKPVKIWAGRWNIEVDMQTRSELRFTIPEDFSSGPIGLEYSSRVFTYDYYRVRRDFETIVPDLPNLQDVVTAETGEIYYLSDNRLFVVREGSGESDELLNRPSLAKIALAEAGTIVVSNESNGLYKSADSGSTWERIELDPQVKINDLYVSDSRYTVVAEFRTGGAQLLTSPDAGITWDVVTTSSTFKGLVNSKVIYNEDKRLILYDRVEQRMLLTDDLKLWAKRSSFFFSNTTSEQFAFFVTSLSRIWSVVGGGIYFSQTGGREWDRFYHDGALDIDAKIMGIHFFNIREGMAIANDGGVLKTSDGGMNWTLQHIPVGIVTNLTFDNASKSAYVSQKQIDSDLENLVRIDF